MLCSHMYVHSGRHGNENFAGFGNRPPLVIEGECAYVRWQTDGSNEVRQIRMINCDVAITRVLVIEGEGRAL
jgi:hypothetical protein